MTAAPTISDLDRRVLDATDRRYERTPQQIGQLADRSPDVALSCLCRLRIRYLVEVDGRRPAPGARRAGFAPPGATGCSKHAPRAERMPCGHSNRTVE